MACSSTSGAGIPDLVAALDAMVSAAPEGTPAGRARQFVDRVFTIAGAGTVATGTLVQGRLDVGDEVEVQPAGVRARIRGLQSHKRRIETARPVARVAVNLAGLERGRVERGDVLARPGEWRPTDVLEARIRPVRGLAHAVTSRGAFTFHAGAAERGATLRLYGAGSLPSDGAFARIRLSDPLVLDVHDRFVLRESGRRETVAGGIVLDPAPPRRPGGDAEERLARREGASRSELPSLVLAERGAVRDDDLLVLTGLGAVEGSEPAGGWWIDDRVRAGVGAAVRERLRELHEAAPAAEGADAGDVRSAALDALRRLGAPADRDLAETLLDDLVREGEVVRSGPSLRLPSHRGGVAGAEVERVVDAVASAEPTPPTIAELVARGLRARGDRRGDPGGRAGAGRARPRPDARPRRAGDRCRSRGRLRGGHGQRDPSAPRHVPAVRRAPPRAPRPDGRDAPERRSPVRPRNLVAARGAINRGRERDQPRARARSADPRDQRDLDGSAERKLADARPRSARDAPRLRRSRRARRSPRSRPWADR